MSNLIKACFGLIVVMALSSCGGGSSGGDGGGESSALSLFGTAAAGAPIIGNVTVKGANPTPVLSVPIEADGSYRIDVTSLTPPYRLRAEGTVGGQTIELHSYAESAEEGGIVNITPFTDLIIANAAGQLASSFFESTTDTEIPAEALEEQEAALQARLQPILTELGVEDTINLLTSSFQADRQGLDAALDLVRIDIDEMAETATIAVLDAFGDVIDELTDDLSDANDNAEILDDIPPEELDNIGERVSDTQAIDTLFSEFNALFDGGLPLGEQISQLLATDFLQEDLSASQFSVDLSTDQEVIGLELTTPVIQELDSENGYALVTFNVRIGGVLYPDALIWSVFREGDVWKLGGDQSPVEIQRLDVHCNGDAYNEDVIPQCAFNTQVDDFDFLNNGGSEGVSTPAQSATVSIYSAGGFDSETATELQSPKAIIYLGQSPEEAPGELYVYNPSIGGGSYTGDYVDTDNVNPSVLNEGDQIVYRVWTQPLDLSNALSPVAPNEAPFYVFDEVQEYQPTLVPMIPTISDATKEAVGNFELGQALLIEWTSQTNKVADEVLLQVETQTDTYRIWRSSLPVDTTSVTFSAAELLALDVVGEFDLLVRVYTRDRDTGQTHSNDLRRSEYIPCVEGCDNGGEEVVDVDDMLVGSWELPREAGTSAFEKTYLTLTQTGEFFFFNLNDDGDPCRQRGYEYGTVTYSETSLTLTPVIDTNGCVGIIDTDESTVTLNIIALGVNSVTLADPDPDDPWQNTFARLQTTSNSIIGPWHEPLFESPDGDANNLSNLVLFLPNGYFYTMDADPANPAENDFGYGTYGADIANNMLSLTFLFSGNGAEELGVPRELNNTEIVDGRWIPDTIDDAVGLIRVAPDALSPDPALAFTQTELNAGLSLYVIVENEEDCNFETAIEEWAINANGYTLDVCGAGGPSEEGAYNVLESGVLQIPGFNEFVARRSFDPELQAYSACWEDSELAASMCSEQSQAPMFLSRIDAEAYLASLQSNQGGFLELAAGVYESQIEGDASPAFITVNDDQTGSWTYEQEGGLLTWEIDNLGALILNFGEVGTERYTLISGTLENGTVNIEFSNESPANATWIRLP